MTALHLPSLRASDVSARHWARLAVIAVALGCAALAVGQFVHSLLFVGAAVGALFALAGAAYLWNEPGALFPMAIYVLWFEALPSPNFPVNTGRIVAFLALAIPIARILTSNWRLPAIAPRVWVMPMATLIWCVLSGLWCAHTGRWLLGLLAMVLAMSYTLMFAIFVKSVDQVMGLMRIFVVIGALIGVASMVVHFGFGYRSFGFTGGPNEYALINIEAVPICVVLARRHTGWWRLFFALCVPGFFGATLAASSRSGLIGLAVVGGFCFVGRPGLTWRQRFTWGFVGLFVVAGGLVLAAILNPERFSLVGFASDRGAGRLDIWAAGIYGLRDHWLLGYGLGGFPAEALSLVQKATGASLDVARQENFRLTNNIPAHNIYLGVWLDMGIIGFLLYFGTFAMAAKNLYDMLSTEWRDVAWIGLGVFVAFLAIGPFASGFNPKIPWSMVGISGALYVRRSLTAREANRASRLGPGIKTDDYTPPALPAQPLSVARSFGQELELYRGVRPHRTRDRLEFRLPWRFARMALASMVLGAVLCGGLTALFGTPIYHGRAVLLVVKLDDPPANDNLTVVDAMVTSIASLARSQAYFAELQREIGSDVSVDDIADMVDSDRPMLDALVEITVTGKDRRVVEDLTAHLNSALAAVIDQIREGVTPDMQVNGANVIYGENPSYRGPLYLEVTSMSPYDDDEIIETTQPRVLVHGLIGAVVALFVLGAAGALLHQRPRVSRREDIGGLLHMPELGDLPRPPMVFNKRARRAFEGFAADLVGGHPDGLVVGFAGAGTATMRRRVALTVATLAAETAGRDVLVLDLTDWGRFERFRRSAGLLQLLRREASSAMVERSVARWAIPWWLRGTAVGRVKVVRRGTGEASPSDDFGVAGIVAQERTQRIVVLILPELPGSFPIANTLSTQDLCVLTVLDGWTALDDARVVADALRAGVDGQTGLVLVEN